MRIIFLNRFYWPDESATAQLLTDLATGLAQRGHLVTVITSRPSSTTPREVRDRVTIERVAATSRGRTNLIGRFLDLTTFFPGALWRLWRVVHRGDLVVALTDPPMIGAAAALVSSLRGARLIHWTHDIYPEIAVEISGQRWLLVLRPVRNFAWRCARACVVPSSDMAVATARAGVSGARIVVSPNWPPRDLAPAAEAEVRQVRRDWDLDGKLVLMYSGNLGRVHNFEPLLRVAELLRDDPGFAFVFVGGGAQRAAVEAAAKARGLDRVQFRPAQPRAQLAATLAAGDVHLITLKRGAERWVFPSKLYGIAAVGRPTLFVGPPESELARLVETHGLGAAFAPDAADAIVALLRHWRDVPAQRALRGAAAVNFSRNGFPDALAMWDQLVSTDSVAPTLTPASRSL